MWERHLLTCYVCSFPSQKHENGKSILPDLRFFELGKICCPAVIDLSGKNLRANSMNLKKLFRKKKKTIRQHDTPPKASGTCYFWLIIKIYIIRRKNNLECAFLVYVDCRNCIVQKCEADCSIKYFRGREPLLGSFCSSRECWLGDMVLCLCLQNGAATAATAADTAAPGVTHQVRSRV